LRREKNTKNVIITQIISQSPSPDLQPLQPLQPIQPVNQTFYQSPSPQPSKWISVGESVVSENCGPASRSHSVESIPTFQLLFALYEFPEEVLHKYSSQTLEYHFGLAMKRALDRPNLHFDIVFRPLEFHDKKIIIEWRVETESLRLVQHQVERKGFEEALTCELAKIDNGSFNVYLSRGKQLTIINEGWALLRALKDSLVSRNRRLEKLLATPKDKWFYEEAFETLFKVSEDAPGNALRGKKRHFSVLLL